MSGRRDVLTRIPELAALAQQQADVCSRYQLRRLGLRASHVDAHLGAGRWQTLGPLLVVLHRGPLTVVARRWAAALNAGPDGALACWTALEEWGLQGWARDAVHVVVHGGARPPVLPVDLVGPVVTHESRRHIEEDVRRKGGLRVHAVERATVDAAAWSRHSRTACGVLAATVQQGLTTADRLLEQLDRVGRVWGARLMRGALADIGGGSQALSEIDFVRLCRRHGLPEPTRQAVRRDSRGRRRYLDVEWRLPDGRVITLEIDGIGHLEVQRWYDDLLRTAELLAAGSAEPVRLPAMAVRAEPERVARLLDLLLAPLAA